MYTLTLPLSPQGRGNLKKKTDFSRWFEMTEMANPPKSPFTKGEKYLLPLIPSFRKGGLGWIFP
jgi:hypothetical protein